MEVEISFKLLLKSLIKHVGFIILITVVVATLVGLYTHFFVTPIYQATTTSSLLIEDMHSTQGNNLNTTINMMKTYARKVKSDQTMEIASNMISNGRFTADQLRSIISVEYEDDGTILYISAVYTDPVNAARIADAVTEAAQYSIDGVEWEILNNAVAPSSPTSPSIVKNVLLSAIVAFLLAYGVFLLADIYNTKIVSEEQLAEALKVPVIGIIPMIDLTVQHNQNTEEETDNEQK